MGANSFGMAITIGIQLASLPLFLHYWDISTYGVWLMLSAVPSYLSMADVGMVAVAGNKMTMAMGKGNLTEANKIFQSAQVFMILVCGFVALLVLLIVLFVPFHGLEDLERRIALIALSGGVLLSLFGGLSEAVFRSTERYALGTLLGHLVRLGEWLGMVTGLMLVGSFSVIALCSFAARLFGTILVIWYASSGKHGLRWGKDLANKSEIIALIKPAIGFMILPMSNALSFQGVTLLVGTLLGPAMLSVFNTYRTISRITVQMTAMFSHALWPEFSRLFGNEGMKAVQPIYKRSYMIGLAQAIGLSTLLYFISPWLLNFWTHGQIKFISDLMLIMLVYAAIGGVWHVPRGLLMAINQPMKLAQWTLLAGIGVIPLTWWFGHYWQLQGVAMAMVFSELFIAVICIKLAHDAISSRLSMESSN